MAEDIDWTAELEQAERDMARNKALVEAGETFRGTKPQWKLGGPGTLSGGGMPTSGGRGTGKTRARRHSQRLTAE